MPNKISAVIVAHNEEKKIEDCLRSLHFVDEIVVVLDKCTDGTKAIVQNYTNKIIEGSWNIEGVRRNVSLDNATGDWIIVIDADERITPELAEEILSIRDSAPCIYSMPIHNYVGKRFVKYGWLRTMGVTKKENIHYRGLKRYHEDKEIHPTADFFGEVKPLKNPYIHLVDDDVFDLIRRFNRNTTWKGNDMVFNGKVKGGTFSLLWKLKTRFIKSFIFKKGYKEGALGVLIAALCGLYPLASYLKAKERLMNENR